MSVLNQMLRDLETRGAPPPPTAEAIVARVATDAAARSTGAPRWRADTMRLADTEAPLPESPPLAFAAAASAPRRRNLRRALPWVAFAALTAATFGALQWLEHRSMRAARTPQPLGLRDFGAALPNATSAPPIAPMNAPTNALVPSVVTNATATDSPGVGVATQTSDDSAAAPLAPQNAAPITSTSPSPATAAENVVPTSPTAPATRLAVAKSASPAPRSTSTAAPKSESTRAMGSATAAVSTVEHADRTTAPDQPNAAVAPANRTVAAVLQPSARSGRQITRPQPNLAERIANLIDRGHGSEATALLREQVATQPLAGDARATLIALLVESQRPDEAFAVLSDGAAIEPTRFAMPAAQWLAQRGDAAGALATLDRVPAAARNAAFFALHAGITQRQGAHAAAVEGFRRALALAPGNPLWEIALATSLEAGARGVSASTDLAEAQAIYTRIDAAAVTVAPEIRRYVRERRAALDASLSANGSAR